jgi:gliding motility-associated-like protein
MLKNCILSCLLLLLMATKAFSSMQMKCVNVATNGDATISWFNSSSTLGFHAYYIYHSTSAAGPYTLEDSILVYATQTYTDVTANANSSYAFYFVVLKSTIASDLISDTIQAIKLSALNIGNNGYATLNWNLTHTPRIVTNSPYYKIYRKYTASAWALIDSVDIRVSLPTYLQEITICSDTIKYRVEVEDNSGCVSVSNVDGTLFRDLRPPSVPVVDSVSMDAFGNANIGWQPNPSVDTKIYIVLQFIGSGWTPIDTLYGINNTFLQTTVDVSDTSQQFRILAIDSCGNPTAMSQPHQTLVLTGTLNKCSSTFQLNWNSYINGAFSSPYYQVIMNVNGGPDSLLTTTVANSFLVAGLIADTAYCFRINAIVGSSATSTSDTLCITPDLPVDPLFSYIRKVTVAEINLITVEALVDTAADIFKYRLLRSDSYTGPFYPVATINATGNPIISFNDNVKTDRPYYYVVEAIDSCGYNALNSQVSGSIHLIAAAMENYTNSISWNDYVEWDGQVSNYVIQRYTTDNGIWQDINTIAYGNSPLYTDVVMDEYSTNGDFCYRVLAVESNGNQYGFIDSVFSNEVCVQQQPIIFFPNAFRPGGINGIFKPQSSFLNLETYSLKIFNRFGQLVFETTKYYEGWNGLFFGKGAPEGVYVYYLIAKGGDGIDIKRVGSFTLVR